MKINKMCRALFLITTCFCYGVAQAGVVVGGTRVVYNGDKKEASLSVKNNDDIPYLIQTWADSNGPLGNIKDKPKAPFVVTPPLFRLDANNENIVQIIRTGGDLPEDRESVFWLNIKSIPGSSSASKNVLQISVKNRIKLFYRPGNISAPTETDYTKVTFHREGGKIRIDNPTPYYLSFFSINMGTIPIKINNIMAPPKGNVIVQSANVNSGDVKWKVINDFGGPSKEIVSKLQ